MKTAAVIGCGRMGARHVEALMGLGFEIVGLYDINRENCEAVANKYHLNPHGLSTEIDRLFKENPLDLCVIATTAPSHKEYIFQAVEANIKKILCEKPLAISVKECLEIMKVAEEKGVAIAVNHQMRYLDQYIIPKKMLQTEEFGGLESVSVTAGNFGMAMNGLHYIEMMRYMFDESPSRVTAWFDNADLPNPRGPHFIDKSGCLRITTATGKRFYLDASASNGHGITVTYAAKRGQIVVDELAGYLYSTHRNIQDKDLPSTRYGQPSLTQIEQIKPVDIIKSTQQVIRALMEGHGYPNLAEATHAIKALVAGYVSNQKGNSEMHIHDETLPLEQSFPWA